MISRPGREPMTREEDDPRDSGSADETDGPDDMARAIAWKPQQDANVGLDYS